MAGGCYSFRQLEQLWVQAGGSPAWAPTMAGIALAESGGCPGAVNSNDPNGGSYGLWQINGVHAPGGNGGAAWGQAMLNPQTNAKMAVNLLGGGPGCSAWMGDPVGQLALNAGCQPLSLQSIEQALAGVGKGITGTSSGPGMQGGIGRYSATTQQAVLTADVSSVGQTDLCECVVGGGGVLFLHVPCLINKLQLQHLEAVGLMTAGGLMMIIAGLMWSGKRSGREAIQLVGAFR